MTKFNSLDGEVASDEALETPTVVIPLFKTVRFVLKLAMTGFLQFPKGSSLNV